MVPLLTNLYNILQRYILNLNITTFPLCFYTRWNMNYKLLDDTKKINSRSLKTIFQHKACTDKLYADSFYKVQKNSHSSFEVICCRS